MQKFSTTTLLITLTMTISLTFFRCGTSKKSQSLNKPVRISRAVIMTKGPCFGNCGVYSITVLQNGIALLEGKEHVELKGVYFTELNDDVFSSLVRDLKKIDHSKLQDRYFINIPDLPSTAFQFYNTQGEKIKEVTSNTKLPDDLQEIQSKLANISKSSAWTQIQKKEDMINPEIIYNELQIDLDSSYTVENLISDYSLYNLKVVHKLSPYMNLYLVTYDGESIGKYEMLLTLRRQKGVRTALFNRKLKSREE